MDVHNDLEEGRNVLFSHSGMNKQIKYPDSKRQVQLGDSHKLSVVRCAVWFLYLVRICLRVDVVRKKKA